MCGIDQAEVQRLKQLEGMKKYILDVVDFDETFDVSHITEPTVLNLAFQSNALAGEVGELCNIVKKIWRDGETPERMQDLDEELVDIVIYLIQVIRTAGTDFDAAWDKKQRELRKRWYNSKPGEYNSGYDPSVNDFLMRDREP